VYFFIIFILFFLSYFEFFLSKNYLPRILITLIAGLIFFILFGFNTYSPDLENYKNHFADLDQDYIKLAVEPFIFFLMETCKNYGLTFEGYQIVFSFFTFSLFLFALLKFTPLPIFVLFNFYFFPFYPDIAQMRFFLAFAIFLFSLQFFNNKKLFFYIFLILAILCHFSILIMLLFLVLRNFKFFKNQITCNLIIIGGVILLLFIPKNIADPFLSLIDPKLLIYKESDNVGTYIGTIALFLPFYILNNLVIYWHNKNYINNNFNLKGKHTKNISLFIELMQFSNFMILFQYFIRDINRITQNIHIILIIYLTIIAYSFIKKKQFFSGVLILIGFFFINLFIFYTQFLMVNNFEYFDVINKTFTNNSFFDYIVNLFYFF
jgi:hypothetical protein